ncbi:hypothetical protein KIPB_013677 [Kipferlia bialata]|uniref:Uncharacterized protein n=1 Tax=Kipferlia bialata TaxID=797122 RepID=A0A9K3GP24_9EUKA|nr:hypothetical protein KIPB_013677 [Kipferlia bialata]|eukprot:g13677.t1
MAEFYAKQCAELVPGSVAQTVQIQERLVDSLDACTQSVDIFIQHSDKQLKEAREILLPALKVLSAAQRDYEGCYTRIRTIRRLLAREFPGSVAEIDLAAEEAEAEAEQADMIEFGSFITADVSPEPEPAMIDMEPEEAQPTGLIEF